MRVAGWTCEELNICTSTVKIPPDKCCTSAELTFLGALRRTECWCPSSEW